MAQRTVEEKLALLRQHDDGVSWNRISEESGVPVRTLGRWAATFHAARHPVDLLVPAAPTQARSDYRES